MRALDTQSAVKGAWNTAASAAREDMPRKPLKGARRRQSLAPPAPLSELAGTALVGSVQCLERFAVDQASAQPPTSKGKKSAQRAPESYICPC